MINKKTFFFHRECLIPARGRSSIDVFFVHPWDMQIKRTQPAHYAHYISMLSLGGNVDIPPGNFPSLRSITKLSKKQSDLM